MKFADLGLHPSIIEALNQLNITECTDIQKNAIPLILEGKDISGLSQTGTGKTFAFAIPLLERLLKTKEPSDTTNESSAKRRFEDWNSGNFILVLVPTRELADQINKSILSLSQKIKTAVIYGGVEYEAQIENLKNGVDFVIGTPGRLIDLYKNHLIHFRHAKAIVFDEADRMFDMGFKDDMVYILQRAPQDRQILLFSATLNFDVMNTIYRFDSNPVEINVSRDQAKAGDVTDEIFHVGEQDKPQYLLSLINRVKPKQTIIFSNFKMNVDRITQFLSNNGVPAVGISSLLTQSQRERVLEQFKNENERNTLVATDVAARGLDIKGVDLVINFDLPDDAENYVHRIGRTGRAGAKGHAISLVSDRDVMALSRIEGYMKAKITIGWLEDEFLIKDFKALQRDNYRGDSRVKKTGLAAMKAQMPQENRQDGQRQGGRHQGGGRFNKNRNFDNRNRDNRDNRDSGSGESVHRDRKSGRHQHPRDNEQRANGQNPNQQGKRPHGQHKGNQRFNSSGNNPNKPGQKSFRDNRPNNQNKKFDKKNNQNRSFKSNKPTKSVSQKVKNFFKSLFR